MSKTLLKRNVQQLLKPFIGFLAVLAMYMIVIIYMYDPKLMDMLNDFQDAMPSVMSAVGMNGIATSLIEFMKIYLYGFLLLLLPTVFSFIAGNVLLMRYINSGSLACILATPNTRRKIIVTQAFSMAAGSVLLMMGTSLIGLISSQAMFPGELDIETYIALNSSVTLLQLLIAGIVFSAACVFNEAKYYYLVGMGVPIVFFLIDMLSNMGDKLEFLKYLTIYRLVPMDDLLKGTGHPFVQNGIMFFAAIVLFGTACHYFTKKDLNL